MPPRTFGRFVVRGLWLPALCALVMAFVTIFQIRIKPPAYVSLARVMASSHLQPDRPAAEYREYLRDYYGALIELLESREMSKRALAHVRALTPALPTGEDVDVRVFQNKESSILNVVAITSSQEFSQVFLDSLLDEFQATLEIEREKQRKKSVEAVTEDLVKAETHEHQAAERLKEFEKISNLRDIKVRQVEAVETMKALLTEQRRLQAAADVPAGQEAEKISPRQRLAAIERELAEASRQIKKLGPLLEEGERRSAELETAKDRHQEAISLVQRLSIAEDMRGEYVSIVERACKAVEDDPPWVLPLAVSTGEGFTAGMLLLLLCAAFRPTSRPQPVPPPLPVSEA